MKPEDICAVGNRALEYVTHASYTEISVLAAFFLALVSLLSRKPSPRITHAPFHGYRSFFEPTLWVQIRFTTDAYNIITTAYKYLKDVPFVLRRYDTDITVLPIKYLDEMRLIPRSKLNGKKAQVNVRKLRHPFSNAHNSASPVMTLIGSQNLVPKWTWTQVMMDSDLHVSVLNAKLNPELAKYMDIAYGELEYGWNLDVPMPEKWTEVDIQQSMRMLVARMSARIFMGYPACREDEWLKLSINFTYDMFMAAFTLRMFPPWLHPIVAHFVPARWRIRKQMRVARRFVQELTRKHMEAKEKGEKGQDTLLGWMIDHGTEKERTIPEMAARQCVLTLASIHTTSMSVSNLLFDLCSHPEWLPVLQDEVDSVVKAHGAFGESRLSSKQWLSKLEKMDSLIVESQRANPPILLNPQRIALVPLTLKDGTKIPAGARIAWAGYHHANDPSVIDKPEEFDPLRSYRKRHINDSVDFNKFIAGQTNSNSLSFGYGNQACPGRYFAVGEIKMILMSLLLEFEFMFPEGRSRPKTMYADENVFMDPHAKLMMRKRNKSLVH
ncbi:cytochrome P450, partial [Metarhizium majus ARSEF 297]